MRRGLVHGGAWLLAAGAAATLSWFGVHTGVSGPGYDPPRALPLPGGLVTPSGARPGAEPETDSTRRPGPSPEAGGAGADSPESSRSARSRGTEETPGVSGSTGGSGGSTRYGASGDLESRSVRGGRAAFDLGPDSATLVSATPNAGWDMRVWRESQWIRVTFTRGEEASSVFCVWHGGPPRVVVDEHGG